MALNILRNIISLSANCVWHCFRQVVSLQHPQPMISLSGYLTIASCTLEMSVEHQVVGIEKLSPTECPLSAIRGCVRQLAPAVVSLYDRCAPTGFVLASGPVLNTFDVPSELLLSTSTTGHFNPCRSSDSNVAPTISSRLNTGMTTVSKRLHNLQQNEKRLFFII